MAEAFICDYLRTPIGRFGGALTGCAPTTSPPCAALMSRHQRLDWAAVDDVVFGCANQAGEDNRNVARSAAAGRAAAGSARQHGEPPVRLGHGRAADRGAGDRGR